MITKELIKKDNDNGIFNLKFAIKNTIEYLKEHQKETITLQQVTDSLICQVLKEEQIEYDWDQNSDGTHFYVISKHLTFDIDILESTTEVSWYNED